MNLKKKLQENHGFTLVELLVVIGILAILTAVVLVAVNPGQQLQDARNTERRAEVNAILNAISAYMADPANNGQPPGAITGNCDATPATYDQIGDATTGAWIDLATPLAPVYIAALPEDPADTTAGGDTGYEICSGASNRITVTAPDAEGTTISVTR
jgi:prepilin-type N-terminal cleavage/methylation domain-containing protein